MESFIERPSEPVITEESIETIQDEIPAPFSKSVKYSANSNLFKQNIFASDPAPGTSSASPIIITKPKHEFRYSVDSACDFYYRGLRVDYMRGKTLLFSAKDLQATKANILSKAEHKRAESESRDMVVSTNHAVVRSHRFVKRSEPQIFVAIDTMVAEIEAAWQNLFKI